MAYPTRIWGGKIRRPLATVWEKSCDRVYFYAQANKSSTQAAVDSSDLTEASLARNQYFVQLLVGLWKCYETVLLNRLFSAMVSVGHHPRLAYLTALSYRFFRTIKLDECFSKVHRSWQGIVAGCSRATSALRCFFLRPLDNFLRLNPKVHIRAYVDDMVVTMIFERIIYFTMVLQCCHGSHSLRNMRRGVYHVVQEISFRARIRRWPGNSEWQRRCTKLLWMVGQGIRDMILMGQVCRIAK